MSRLFRAVGCFVPLCALSLVASAQLSTATAFGNVTDPTGAEVPGATIVFTQTQTNFTRTTRTNIGNSAATEPEDYHNLSLERQRETNDMRNQAVISGVWKPDYFENFNPVARHVLDGWSIAATLSMHSGKPFTITSGNDDNVDGNNNDRPNLFPGDSERPLGAHRSRQAEMAQWFDTSVYCRVATAGCPAGDGPSGLDGLVRADSLDGPGYKDVDASLFRDFTIHEDVKFQFRGEATNVFNFVNLSNPGGSLNSSSSFGQISGAGAMRVLQVGGRLLF